MRAGLGGDHFPAILRFFHFGACTLAMEMITVAKAATRAADLDKFARVGFDDLNPAPKYVVGSDFRSFRLIGKRLVDRFPNLSIPQHPSGVNFCGVTSASVSSAFVCGGRVQVEQVLEDEDLLPWIKLFFLLSRFTALFFCYLGHDLGHLDWDFITIQIGASGRSGE